MHDPYHEAMAQSLRDFARVERALRPLDSVDATLREIARGHAVHDQFRDVWAERSLAVLMNEQLSVRDIYGQALDALGGAAGLHNLAAQAGGAYAAFDRADVDALAGPAVQAQLTLAKLGVSDVLTSSRFRELGAFGRPEREALTMIGAAAGRFEALSKASSFARVGTAMNAAAGALSWERLSELDYRRVIDPFFGDWARIAKLPETYGLDPGVRREVLEEIEADESFLDVSPDEAAALIKESSFDRHGTPIVLLGEPIALVVTQDPDDVAARLIRRVERALRDRITRVLQKRHGKNWPQILMPERAQEWSERRMRDAADGLPTHDLIHYSEFTELAWIITQRWNDGFAGRVTKASRVTNRIQALAPHRNYEFHSRPMTPEQLIGIVYAVRELEAFLLDDNEDANDF